MKHKIIYILLFLLLIIPFADWFKHPEMTQMQFFVKWAWAWGALVLIAVLRGML